MPFKPVKKIKGVKQAGVSGKDLLRRPKVPQFSAEPAKESFGLRNRQLVFAGKEVGRYIQDVARENPALLAQVAAELEKFRDESLKKRKKKFSFFKRQEHPEYSEEEIGQIFALCDAHIQRISELIQKRYQDQQDGYSLEFLDNGQLLLNGMNMHELVAQCRDNPNQKSLIFLKGIQGRLNRVLESKIQSRNYDRIKAVVLELLKQTHDIFSEHSHLLSED